MNVITQPELSKFVDGKYVGQYYTALRADEIYEFRGGLRVREESFDRDVLQAIETYQDRWQLYKNKPYIIEFKESYTVPEEFDGIYTPFILPSSLPLQVGGVASPRLVTDDDLWTLFVPNMGIDVDVGAVLAVMLIVEIYNPAAGKEEVTESEESDEDR